MYFHLSPKERLGYAAIVGLLLFAAGYIGAQKLKQPAPLVFEAPAASAAPAKQSPPRSAAKSAVPVALTPVRGSSKRLAALGSVSLNKASESDLETLPGVGPAMAQRILDFRTQNGPFHAIEDLRHVRGIGAKRLAAMRKYLRL